ncbi:MAG: hypothetical protein R3B70_35865 [Polyangiaceae bacterium]
MTNVDFKEAPKAKSLPERIRELRALMAAFSVRPIDPTNPADARRYFPFHKEPGRPRGRDPIQDLRNTILLLPETETCQIFSGFQGTGKSTELRRLSLELQEQGFPVLFVEGASYINIYEPLEISDLLLGVAAAVGELLQARLGKSPLERTLGEHLIEFFSRIKLTQIDVGLSAAMGLGPHAPEAKIDVAKLRLELSQNPAFKAKVQDAFRGSLRVFFDAFSAFMRKARELFGGEAGPCPVLIVDDLEKIQGSGQQQDHVQRQIEQVFSAFSHALKIDGWHTIWASPPYLPFLNTAIAQQYDAYVLLPMVRLWDETDPARKPVTEGLSAMRKFLRLRGDVDSLVQSEALLDELIVVSSGHVRDLCRLMQDVLRDVVSQDDPNEPLGPAVVRQIVNDYVAGAQRAVYTDDLPFLRVVADTRRAVLSSGAHVLRVAKLFDTQLVMIYRNGGEWFDVSVPVQRLLAAG